MNKIFLDEKIYYIENFIDEFDMKIILKDFENLENWEIHGVFYIKPHHTVSEETKVLLDKYKRKVQEVIDDELNMLNWNNALQKYAHTQGEWAIAPHSDRFDAYGIENARDSSKYVTQGFILYFNDDYVGGEVEYVNKNILIKPKAGMLLVHSGFEEYRHGVRAVLSGERYMITGFVYERDYFESSIKD